MSSTAVLTVHNCAYVPPTSTRTALDGDTFRCMGVVEPIIPDSHQWIPKVRVVRINAPETGMSGADRARTALIEWLQKQPFDLVCYSRDKYGRMLADAHTMNGFLSDYMLDNGFAQVMTLATARNIAYTEIQARAIVHPVQLQRELRAVGPENQT
jgi:endonuclease YncB( thermonuclease family)